MSDLPLPANTFDLATAFETVYFWPGLEKCFAQVAKVLKPGGYFMVCNESDGTDPTSLKFEKIIDGMKNYTAEEIEATLKAAGSSFAANVMASAPNLQDQKMIAGVIRNPWEAQR